ncbi:substrate-binding domain-containing protein [Streptomyces sp. NPDC001816]|uniref:substrate-binding domain-containing protein n=1 Tax=Streptomyces sp. NPDC001816 TaxID=3364612 RepID=UPI0036747A3D
MHRPRGRRQGRHRHRPPPRLPGRHASARPRRAHPDPVRRPHRAVRGARGPRHLLDEGELPTAVVAYNDQCAIGVLAALSRAGVPVPGRVSVAGYDDDALSRLSLVDLTTVSQSAEDQARHAVRAAVERLDEGRKEPREVVLAPRLVIRGSTGGVKP